MGLVDYVHWIHAPVMTRNFGRDISIDNKSSFIVIDALGSPISRFKWFHNLVIDFKFDFFTFLVKTDYN